MPGASIGVPTSDDETLVALARQGDRPACEELFRRHWVASYRVAYRLLGHEHDALDAVQDALLKAVAHLDDFDGRSGFRTWLLRIVHNAALDAGRKRKRRKGSGQAPADGPPGVPDPPCLDDPAQGLYRQDLRRQLDAALDRLAPKIRHTFILFAEGGLGYKEIAQVLEIPIGTVMSRLNYARQKLQSYIDLDRIEQD
jgi:RNA polymerase sigma-70 factor (ECF subfamily)